MEDLNDKINDGGATSAGKLTNVEWNQPMSELQSIIESTGQTLASGTLTQLGDAIAAMAQGDSYFGTDTGSSVAYVVAAVNTVHHGAQVGLFTGMHCRFRPANTSTSTNPTLNAFSSGVKNILAENGSALAIGDLSTTRDAECRYDGTQWILLDRSTALRPIGTYPPGYINGFLQVHNLGDSYHDINIHAGSCTSSDGTLNLTLGSMITRSIDVNYGTGNGGLPIALGTIPPAGAWLRVFIIGGAAVTEDAGFDTSATATNLLNDAGASYNKYRQVGWIYSNGVRNVSWFWINPLRPNYVAWANNPGGPVRAYNDTPTQASHLISIPSLAPPQSMVEIVVSTRAESASADVFFTATFNHPDEFDVSPDNVPPGWADVIFEHDQGANHTQSTRISVGVNDNSEFYMHVNSQAPARVDVGLTVVGFHYDRESL